MFKILFFILAFALILIPNKKASRVFTMLFLFATFLAMGLRHMSCYQDTYGYVQHYYNVGSIHWGQLADTFDKDVFFWYFSKFISLLSGGNYTVWLLIISFIYIASFYFLIKKESSLPSVSALVMVVIGLYYFAFTGLRQALALAFISLAIYYLLNKQIKWAALMVVVAGLFHITSLFFFVVFPLIRVSIKPGVLVFYLIVGVIIYYLGSNFSDFIDRISVSDRFARYAESENSLSFTGFFIKLFLLGSSYFFLGKSRHESKNQILLHLAIIGLVVQSLSFHLAEMFRISMYFSISYILLFSNSIVEYKRRSAKVDWPVLFVVLSLVYILFANSSIVSKEYYFFFESPVGVLEIL